MNLLFRTHCIRSRVQATMIDLFRTPTVRWALFITVFLQLSQQLSGINAVFIYSTTIFRDAQYSEEQASYANLGLGATNLIVTVISVFLMDLLGRRLLHLIGLGGMFGAMIVLIVSLLVKSSPAWNVISLITTICFIGFFAIGPGAIPWLITSELFSQAYRVPATSVAVLVNWSANFAVSQAFKPLYTVSQRSLGCQLVSPSSSSTRVPWANTPFFYSLAFYSHRSF